MSIDPGQRRVGLALSDEDGRWASPLMSLERAGREKAIETIARLVTEHGVSLIVVGLPLRMNGREGMAARLARAFGSEIARRTQVKVEFWDERLSTAEAHRAMDLAQRSHRKRREVIDQAAAVILLQSYLDARLAR